MRQRDSLVSIYADLFTDMMSTSVQVEKFLSRTDAGVPTYASPKSYVARVNMKTHNVIGKDNQLVVARGMAWLDTVDAITVDDRITLDDGTQPILLIVNLTSDEAGPAYTRLDFQ